MGYILLDPKIYSKVVRLLASIFAHKKYMRSGIGVAQLDYAIAYLLWLAKYCFVCLFAWSSKYECLWHSLKKSMLDLSNTVSVPGKDKYWTRINSSPGDKPAVSACEPGSTRFTMTLMTFGLKKPSAWTCKPSPNLSDIWSALNHRSNRLDENLIVMASNFSKKLSSSPKLGLEFSPA